MMKKRALIYGNQKCFSKYIKRRFQDVLEFDVCKDFKFLNEELEVYSVVVLVIYEEEDLIDFFKVYGNGVPLVVCAFNKKVLEIVIGFENIVLVDTAKIRSEILNQLNFYFKETILSTRLSPSIGYKGLLFRC
ncbi:hypothetical protein [Flavobacterium hibernum]|uniref:Uncharacterized protein n=2 Tax=Flavobacterium hibernum TaxID=37752 RepID=A0A0D0ERJ4_9FLAO|nr:hypothetical protein [Flavobacterium hibernum]KIO50753.1 hypothetical protein IW18_21470 [Flavobacterium hibernum]PTT04251.1 hypothetical protein DBR27_09675 [Flavobacterium sp. HMWF030]STO18704.1 Uncharacterised protein [Flavobacterium hibernum]